MFAAISFVFFTALVAVLSYFMTRDENLETQDGYFLRWKKFDRCRYRWLVNAY